MIGRRKQNVQFVTKFLMMIKCCIDKSEKKIAVFLKIRTPVFFTLNIKPWEQNKLLVHFINSQKVNEYDKQMRERRWKIDSSSINEKESTKIGHSSHYVSEGKPLHQRLVLTDYHTWGRETYIHQLNRILHDGHCSMIQKNNIMTILQQLLNEEKKERKWGILNFLTVSGAFGSGEPRLRYAYQQNEKMNSQNKNNYWNRIDRDGENMDLLSQWQRKTLCLSDTEMLWLKLVLTHPHQTKPKELWKGRLKKTNKRRTNEGTKRTCC